MRTPDDIKPVPQYHITHISHLFSTQQSLLLRLKFLIYFMKPLIYILSLFISISAFAQNSKTDKVYLNDGSVLEVNIKKVTADNIEFTYPNETAGNEEKTTNIRTIVFASGRVQQFNTGNDNTTPSSAPAAIEYKTIEPNTLAILPVAFFDKNSGKLYEDHSKLVV